jgi:endonuclease YncB( thermonuclease family)
VLHHFVGLLAALVLFTTGAALGDDSGEPKHVKKFLRFTDCEFIDTAYADGDSFRVRVDGQERVLRLYFVDTPESDTRYPVRNAQQAEYFGFTPEQSVDAGKAAKRFVHDLLSGKKLTIFTRWASALGSSRLPRFYAIVEVDGRKLADVLVESGLARLHGTSVTLPDGTSISDYLAQLRELESAARTAKLGAWEHSVPAKAKPVIEQAKEGAEPPNWLERAEYTGLGAALIGLAWGISHRRGRNTRGV